MPAPLPSPLFPLQSTLDYVYASCGTPSSGTKIFASTYLTQPGYILLTALCNYGTGGSSSWCHWNFAGLSYTLKKAWLYGKGGSDNEFWNIFYMECPEGTRYSWPVSRDATSQLASDTSPYIWTQDAQSLMTAGGGTLAMLIETAEIPSPPTYVFQDQGSAGQDWIDEWYYAPCKPVPPFDFVPTATTTVTTTETSTTTSTKTFSTSTTTSQTTTTTTATLDLRDFSIVVTPSQRVVNPGSKADYTVAVNPANDASGLTVSLTLEGAAGTMSWSLTPTGGTVSFYCALSIIVDPSTPAGTYNMTVVGFGAGKYRRGSLSLVVTVGSGDADFFITLSPHKLAVRRPDAGLVSAGTTISVTSLNGFSAEVDLSWGWVSLPSGVSISLDSTRLHPIANGVDSTNLVFSIDSTASLGNFSLVISGSDATRTRYGIAYLYISTDPQYLVSVISHPLNNVMIDISGDVTGKGVTPFEIGPKKTAFSVTLSAPASASAPGQTGGTIVYAFSRWLLDAAASEDTVLTVQTSQDHALRTADARYFVSHPVTVVIHAPSNGTVVSGFVSIVASVNCGQGHPIAFCKYRIDSGPWTEMLWNGTQWLTQWDSTSVANGGHQITVKGTCTHDSYGTAWVAVTVSNAPLEPVYTYYVNHVSSTWSTSKKFLPGEMMGVRYSDPSMANRMVTISLSAGIVYKPKTSSHVQVVSAGLVGVAEATFALSFSHTICGQYFVTWTWEGGSFQAPFKVVGAAATQWSVYHLYDHCEVHTLLTWFDDSTPILSRQGTIEAYAIYGPYRNVVKGTIAADGGIIVRDTPYFDWSGDTSFSVAYLDTDIKILTSTGQENLKTFHCDVLAVSYTVQGQDYVMMTQSTFFLKYQPVVKVQGVRLSIDCPETYEWAAAQLSNEYGQTSVTLGMTGTPSYFRLLSWAWLAQPPSALRNYIIAGQYANLKTTEERIAVQPTITGARMSGGYFTVTMQAVSQAQWMDMGDGHTLFKVEAGSTSGQKLTEKVFNKAVLHGVTNTYALPVEGVGPGTYVVKLFVYYYGRLVSSTQATLTA